MDKNTKDILEALTFIKDRMATKEDVRDIIREEVPPMIDEAIQRTAAPNDRSHHPKDRAVQGIDLSTRSVSFLENLLPRYISR